MCVFVTLTERRHFYTECITAHITTLFTYMFHYAIDVTGRASQNVCHLFVLRVRTTLTVHKFYIRGSQLWNLLNPLLYATRKLNLKNFDYVIMCKCCPINVCMLWALLKTSTYVLPLT